MRCGVVKPTECKMHLRRVQVIPSRCLLALLALSRLKSITSLYRYDKGRTGSATGRSGLKLLVVTIKLLKEKRQLLILPITMFIGAEQAFLFADYTAVSIFMNE